MASNGTSQSYLASLRPSVDNSESNSMAQTYTNSGNPYGFAMPYLASQQQYGNPTGYVGQPSVPGVPSVPNIPGLPWASATNPIASYAAGINNPLIQDPYSQMPPYAMSQGNGQAPLGQGQVPQNYGNVSQPNAYNPQFTPQVSNRYIPPTYDGGGNWNDMTSYNLPAAYGPYNNNGYQLPYFNQGPGSQNGNPNANNPAFSLQQQSPFMPQFNPSNNSGAYSNAPGFGPNGTGGGFGGYMGSGAQGPNGYGQSNPGSGTATGYTQPWSGMANGYGNSPDTYYDRLDSNNATRAAGTQQASNPESTPSAASIPASWTQNRNALIPQIANQPASQFATSPQSVLPQFMNQGPVAYAPSMAPASGVGPPSQSFYNPLQPLGYSY